MRNLIIVLALAIGVSSCVSKTKYQELESQYDAAQSELAQLQNRVSKLEEQIAQMEARANRRLESLRELYQEFKPLIDRGILEVKVVDGRVVIGMASDILFASGSAVLSDQGKANLAEVAKLLARRTDRAFQVEGHTDNDPISSAEFPSNWYLGSARAINVVNFMVSRGMPAQQLSAASFGDTQPIVDNSSAANKAQNRRIEIVLLPDYSELPGYEKLMEAATIKQQRHRKGNKGKGSKTPRTRPR